MVDDFYSARFIRIVYFCLFIITSSFIHSLVPDPVQGKSAPTYEKLPFIFCFRVATVMMCRRFFWYSLGCATASLSMSLSCQQLVRTSGFAMGVSECRGCEITSSCTAFLQSFVSSRIIFDKVLLTRFQIFVNSNLDCVSKTRFNHRISSFNMIRQFCFIACSGILSFFPLCYASLEEPPS